MMIRYVLTCVVVLSSLCGCSADSTVAHELPELPEFAEQLSGQTAICVHVRRASDVNELDAAIQFLQDLIDGEFERPSPEVYAYRGTTPVKWDKLAESRNFGEAWAESDVDSAAVLYCDLEQLVDTLATSWAQKLGPMQRVLDMLFLSGFRFAVFNLDATQDALSIDGIVRTSGTRAGLPGLLSSEPGGGYLGDPEQNDLLALDGCFEVDVVRQMIERAASENALTEAMAAGVLLALPALIGKHLTGGVSLRAGKDAVRIALGIVDRDGFEETFARLPFVREKSGDLFELPGGMVVRVTETVVYFGNEEFPVPTPAKAESGLWVRSTGDVPFSGTIMRVENDLQVSVKLPKKQ